MPERDDPADSTERRDWDLPPGEEPDDIEQARRAGAEGVPERHPGAEQAPGSVTEPEPADESERRDWDLPPS